MKKKFAAVGLAAGLIAGGAAGLILELSGTASASDDSTSVTDDSTSTTDETDMRGDLLEGVLQPLVDEGTLTSDQVEAVIAVLGDVGGDMGQMGQRGPGGHGMGSHEMGTNEMGAHEMGADGPCEHMDADSDDGSDTDAETTES